MKLFDKITKRSFGYNLLVIIGLIVLIGIIFFGSLGFFTRHGEVITVPDVRGKSIKDATATLEGLGFDVEVRDSIYIDTIPALLVYEQTPERGDVVKVNRTVYLTVNKVVPPMVPMPDLEGLTFRSAEMTLRARRLNIGDTIYKPDFATNTVLQQLLNGKPIKPGKEIPEGSNITLVLSSGTGSMENPVPEIVGLTYMEAREVLAASNLNIGTVLIDGGVTDTLGAFVFKQSPARRNELHELNLIRAGESVDLWLSAARPVKDSVAAPVQQPAEEK
ncbi:PASTA domain-containing protein [Chitinophaga sp. SYP-B3965]|uniref:PASTA domain-containing protein n=1 Tax=Chitinophaga sp. SYP-B3965 TaxID=2663120 RepID=UPI00129953F7|nr:PASTA domain-containing protein [Chitinophaga sp. SYP-B3965]MRG43620.1 PASTA domain-containing protein [Chitinophaga sp. SYP-B3965]